MHISRPAKELMSIEEIKHILGFVCLIKKGRDNILTIKILKV